MNKVKDEYLRKISKEFGVPWHLVNRAYVNSCRESDFLSRVQAEKEKIEKKQEEADWSEGGYIVPKETIREIKE